MLFRIILILSISTGLAACKGQPEIDADQRAALQNEAASIIKQFAGTLKPKLKQALQQGEPARAIEVCSKEAPALALQLSEQTGWTVKRVSLKARNHHTAIPDAWERERLEQFNRDQAAGKPPANMTASRIDRGTYRFMQAQATEPLCLLCHGPRISPDVAAALQKYYPKDQARGYEPGQIRGAFSLLKQL